ncbi:ribonuclease HIII [Bacillus sp. NPDC077027]|uniref:ribonuclease HIII n=1 Tax=Bacillus sp. NPDC077027 TaxID=3390548 RepID=UPI003D05900D
MNSSKKELSIVPQAVINATPEDVSKIKHFYSKQLTDTVPQGALFQAKVPGCTITAYRSGKILFQGKQAEAECRQFGIRQQEPTVKTAKAQATNQYSPPQNIASMSVIGSDEVGTGDYFGPMTVCAAYVDSSHLALMKELGVKDSKGLKDPQIVNIAKDLIQTIPYSLLVLRNEKYNEMQAKGMSQGKMKALLHNQVITSVLNKMDGKKPEAILIDQFAEPGIYFRHLAGKKVIRERTYFSTKAEGIHLSVAAASIIARYAFLIEMDQLSNAAGFDIPKGAGSHVDQAAAKLIKRKGEEALNQFTKLHFANTQKAKKLVR